MFEGKGKPMLLRLRQVILVLVFGSAGLFFPDPILANDERPSSDHGYMLIRITVGSHETVGLLAMSNANTNDVIRIHTNSFEPAGLNAWMALVAMPYGQYYWSEYQTMHGIGAEATQNIPPVFRRSAPDSASDTFEIASGVVNYVGDWRMRTSTSPRLRLNRTVEYEKSTLERYLAQYPEYSNKYEIYLSVMGKKAVSLDEMVKASKGQSDPDRR